MNEPKVIYESARLLAVLKPAGYLTHHSPHSSKNSAPALTDWLLARYPELSRVGDDPETRPGIVHRLDRETSGVLLVARTEEEFSRLKKEFQEHRIKKMYIALAHGNLKNDKGVIDDPISLKPGTTKRTIHGGKMTKEAVTEYAVLRRCGSGDRAYMLLALYPKTGRTHQLRVHLASRGTPIVGDALYGKKKDDSRLMLHALSLEFPEFSGKRIAIAFEPPDDFAATFVDLGIYETREDWREDFEKFAAQEI